MNLRKLLSPLRYSYSIGFLKQEELCLDTLERSKIIKWIDVSKYSFEGWFADPFILNVSDTEIVLLAEEYIYDTGLGVIVKLSIDRKSFKVKEKRTILELPTHLSFPIILEENGKIYVYPENNAASTLSIYEFDKNQDKLIFVKELIHERLVDTQIVKIDNAYYAFGVILTSGQQSDTRILHIYKSDSLLGEYRHFQTIVNDKNEERGAGLIYKTPAGEYIRPAQCCERCYGESVILYRLQFDVNHFIETEIGRIEPDPKSRNGYGLHTFNCSNGICVIDGYRLHYPKLAALYKRIRGIE